MAKKTNQEDVIVDVDELYSKSEQFVDKNRKQLTIGLGGAAALILVVIGYSSLVVAPKNLKAEEASFMAEHYFAKDSADLAMLGDGLNAGLEEIMEDYSGTPAAARAAFELGIMHRDAAEFDAAVEAFKQAGFSDDVFGPLTDAKALKATSPLQPLPQLVDLLPRRCRPCARTSARWCSSNSARTTRHATCWKTFPRISPIQPTPRTPLGWLPHSPADSWRRQETI